MAGAHIDKHGLVSVGFQLDYWGNPASSALFQGSTDRAEAESLRDALTEALRQPELEPCPFCGGRAAVFEAGSEWHCSCEGCAIYLWPKGENSREVAIAAWNRRV